MEAVSLKTLLDNRNKLLKDLQLQDTDTRIRAPIFLTELTVVACLTGLLVNCLSVDRLPDFKIWGLEAWKWWGLLFVLTAGGMAVRLLMDLVLVSLEHVNSALRRKINIENAQQYEVPFDYEENELDRSSLLGRKKLEFGVKVLEIVEKVTQVVGGSRGSIQAIFWIGSIMIAWILLFRMGVKLPDHRSNIMNKVTTGLASLLIGAVLWMVKTVWLQLLAFSLIVERSKERVKRAQEEQKWFNDLWKTVLDLATELKIIKPEEMGNGNETKVLSEELKLIEKDRQWTPKSIIIKIAGTNLPVHEEDKEDTDNVERAARVTAGWLSEQIKAIFGVEDSASDNQKRKAKVIIMKKSKKYEALQKKLEKVTLGSRSFEFIEDKVCLIDDEDRIRRLRKSELEGCLVDIYIDRMVLLRTINGWDDTLCDLNGIVSVMLLVVNIVVWLFAMGLLTTTVAIAIAAQVMAFDFMFGGSAKTAFKAFFFVFESRPFAVGDRCKIDGDDFEMVVHDMNFLSTIFTRSDGEKIYYPNSVLIDKKIDNFFSVPDTHDVIEFFVKLRGEGNDVAETTRQKITEEIDKFLKEKKKKWTKDVNVEIYKLSKKEKIHIVIITVNHQVNFYDGADRAKHRDELLCKLPNILRSTSTECLDSKACREALKLT